MYELYIFRRDGEYAITNAKNGANLPGPGWSPERTISEADLGQYVDKSLERKKEIATNGYVLTSIRA